MSPSLLICLLIIPSLSLYLHHSLLPSLLAYHVSSFLLIFLHPFSYTSNSIFSYIPPFLSYTSIPSQIPSIQFLLIFLHPISYTSNSIPSDIPPSLLIYLQFHSFLYFSIPSHIPSIPFLLIFLYSFHIPPSLLIYLLPFSYTSNSLPSYISLFLS